MKKETYANKLFDLLGLGDTHKAVTEQKAQANRYIPVPEEEIQGYRFAQGVQYFLQAPALFTAKICKHCGEHFLVSRKAVGFCSYTCIRKDLNAMGFEWRKGEDIEALVTDKEVWDGNEPIWIRNLPQLQEALQTLVDSQSKLASM